jgi:hypothetical protein
MDMRDYGDNLGGIRRAWIAKFNIGGTWPSLSLSPNTITQTQLDQLTELPLYPYRAGYTNSPQDGEQGVSFSRSFDTGIPSDSAESRSLMDTFQGWPVILILLDIDGRYWMVFDAGNPGKFLADFSSGVSPTDGKMHTVQIRGTVALDRALLTLLP